MENTVLLGAGKENGIRLELDGKDLRNKENIQVSDVLCQVAAVRPAGIINSCFYRNLLRIDSNLPLIYLNLIYLYYRNDGQISEMKELVKRMSEENVIGFSENWVYGDKVQKLLVETAYGMNAKSDWDGGYRQIIRSIILEKEGKTYLFSGGEREAFGQFLVGNCKVYGSGKKDGFEVVYEQNGRQYINLSVNIVI